MAGSLTSVRHTGAFQHTGLDSSPTLGGHWTGSTLATLPATRIAYPPWLATVAVIRQVSSSPPHFLPSLRQYICHIPHEEDPHPVGMQRDLASGQQVPPASQLKLLATIRPDVELSVNGNAASPPATTSAFASVGTRVIFSSSIENGIAPPGASPNAINIILSVESVPRCHVYLGCEQEHLGKARSTHGSAQTMVIVRQVSGVPSHFLPSLARQ